VAPVVVFLFEEIGGMRGQSPPGSCPPETTNAASSTANGLPATRLLDYQDYWEAIGRHFEWKFKRQDLAGLLAKLGTPR
jgi:hypothetical protein